MPSNGIQLNRQTANNQVYNNTVVVSPQSIISNYNSSYGATNVKIYNNLLTTNMNILNASMYDMKNNLILADPKFIDATGYNFLLQSSSPAINTGLIIPGITDGFVGSAPDKGAYEFGTTPFTVGANF